MGSGGVTRPNAKHWGASEWATYCEKRVAIWEHKMGLGRTESKRRAMEDVVAHWLQLHPAGISDARQGCVHGRSGDLSVDSLLPVLAPGGHVWVHEGCLEAWQRERQNKAQLALQELGIVLSNSDKLGA
jgi:hypothetical protein